MSKSTKFIGKRVVGNLLIILIHHEEDNNSMYIHHKLHKDKVLKLEPLTNGQVIDTMEYITPETADTYYGAIQGIATNVKAA